MSSPGSAQSAITVGATTLGRELAGFSSAGPTPISLRLKPEVTAPGVNILSAAPPQQGLWQELSGTSMAAPHVAGAVALLLQRHPTWTVAQVKSALTTTGQPGQEQRGGAAPTTREGGGFVISFKRTDRSSCPVPPRCRSARAAGSYRLAAPSS